jgi:hypothetical protein
MPSYYLLPSALKPFNIETAAQGKAQLDEIDA